MGVCGKDPESAALQDLLIHGLKGLSMFVHRAGVRDAELDRFVVEALFTTITNVNFDVQRLSNLARRLETLRDRAVELYAATCDRAGEKTEDLGGPATWRLAPDELATQAQALGIKRRLEQRGGEITGLEELVLYGLKGMAAYADHALILGVEDESVYAFFHEVLSFLAEEQTADDLLAMALRVGEKNLKVMEMLDRGHTESFGHPRPTAVPVTARKGKAILVSGHDLKDLEALLEQTGGTGINVYTHGEMLPAHGYPGLKKYAHLAGNYGGAWQNQVTEFDAFPGPILMTTNCIQRPLESYRDRLFTCGLVAWPGVTHIEERDFSPVIEAALAAEGFSGEEPEQTIMVGFARNAVLDVADKVVEAVKTGAIRHFFLIGGCDGARPGRNYYTELAQAVPDDCVILTLACGKYRFNKLDFGDIGGIPRLLDVGQCNDAYSAVQIALALSEAFDTDVNSLPLTLVLSWYEQKAVAILLTLLHLGIRNIRIGPSLPAFLSAGVVGKLVEGFGLTPVSTPEADLRSILQA
jgi:hydroxylamine reductase